LRFAAFVRHATTKLGSHCGNQTGMEDIRTLLENELLRIVGSGRNAAIVARRYGLDGKGRRTLGQIGSEVGLTRERVRQIVEREATLLRTQRIATPILDLAIQTVANQLPATATQLETELQSAGLTLTPFQLEGLVYAAALFDRVLPFSITRVRGVWIVHPESASSLNTIDRLARNSIRRWGATTISEVASLTGRSASARNNCALVASILTSQKRFHWLESPDWFWFSHVRANRLMRRIKKIISVTNPIDVSALRTGIARDYRMASRVPPVPILLEFCIQACGLQRSGDSVYTNQPINLRRALSVEELCLVNLLRDSGGTMSRVELMSGWVKRNANRATLHQMLCYSPIISRHADGIYGLVGVPVASRISRQAALLPDNSRRREDHLIGSGADNGVDVFDAGSGSSSAEMADRQTINVGS